MRRYVSLHGILVIFAVHGCYALHDFSDRLYFSPSCKHPKGFSLVRSDMEITAFGFIKGSSFFDSRQVLGFRENLRLIMPQPPQCDSNGNDINEQGSLTMAAFDSRFRFLFDKAMIRSTEISAYLETDFQGPWITDNTTNTQVGLQSAIDGTTLRHACVRIGLKVCSFLVGLYWHPFVVPESGPFDRVPFERSPFEPVARAPQMRLTLHSRYGECIIAALSQSDFKNNGPNGFSIQYLRNAVLPNLHMQARLYCGDHVLGLALDYKRIIPQLTSTNNTGQLFATDRSVNSFSAMGYAQFMYYDYIARIKVLYASNMTDYYLLPGYGIYARDAVSLAPRFTPVRHWIASCEFFLDKRLSPGLFFGITKNRGTKKELLVNSQQEGNAQFSIFGIGGGNGDGTGGLSQNYNAVDYEFEVAPRIIWNVAPLTIVGEFQYWCTSFGELVPSGMVRRGRGVHNIRLLTSLYYYF